MAEMQSIEGRMMIDSVVWIQYVNVTDRHADRQTRPSYFLISFSPLSSSCHLLDIQPSSLLVASPVSAAVSADLDASLTSR